MSGGISLRGKGAKPVGKDSPSIKHVLVAVCVGVVLPVIASLITLHFQSVRANRNITEQQAFRESVSDEVQKDLQPYNLPSVTLAMAELKGEVGQLKTEVDQLAVKRMSEVSVLAPPQFNQAVPYLGKVLNVADARRPKVPAETIDLIRSKLLSSADRDNAFWKTVGAFTSYRSPPQAAQLPPCPTTISNFEVLKTLPATRDRIIKPGMFAPLLMNCRLDLSNGLPKFTIESPWDRVARDLLRCLRCQVVYYGSPAASLEDSLKAIVFEKCSFYINVSQATPQDGLEFALAVLSSPQQDLVVIPHLG